MGGWWWINPLQTLPQGLVLTFDFDFDFDPDLDKRSEWEEMVKHKVPLKCPESTMCLSKTPLLLFDVLIDYNFLQNATRIKSK